MFDNTLAKADFIGRGLGFPPSFDKANKDILMAEGATDIQESLQIILSTRPNERLLEPDFGCNLDQLLFEPLDVSLISLMQDVVKTAIIRHEPRVKVNAVLIETESAVEGRVTINVDYTIRTTNSRFNFVFPFYIEEGTDINR